jgi:hypothetical protein
MVNHQGRFEAMLGSAREALNAAPAGLEEAMRVIREKAAALPFGTITLTIHDGRVTQLEVNEKRRFAS